MTNSHNSNSAARATTSAPSDRRATNVRNVRHARTVPNAHSATIVLSVRHARTVPNAPFAKTGRNGQRARIVPYVRHVNVPSAMARAAIRAMMAKSGSRSTLSRRQSA